MIIIKKSYIISILIALGVGGLSAFLTRESMGIYAEISTPPLSPPAVLFPIVWTILYVLMGISAAMVYNSKGTSVTNRTQSLFTYGVSLVVNFFWSIIFFNMRMYFLAFVWLVLLWVLILKTILEYWDINKTSAKLQIPYLIWVAFAGYLTFSIFLLNS